MIKKLAKGLGLVVILAAGIGLFVYFDKLKVEGEPALTACWAADIIDDVTGEKVVGAEDLDFDPITGTIFLSAYDRRAVDRELVAGGPVTTQGGIYTLMLSDVQQTGVLPVHDISRAFKEAGNEFRPHGFSFYFGFEEERLLAINRKYHNENKQPELTAVFELFTQSHEGWIHKSTTELSGVCDPYDVSVARLHFMTAIGFTDLDSSCESGWSANNGSIKSIEGTSAEVFLSDLSYPNGLILREGLLAVSTTTDDSILILAPSEERLTFEDDDLTEKTISLPIAPDNLTLDKNKNLYVAGFPNLLDYYFYMSELFGVEKSPSAAYQIAPESYEQTLLFKDDGSLISGATTALRAGDYLILGSAWDDHIAICSGMAKIDEMA